MSSISPLDTDDVARPLRETRPDGSEAVYGPSHPGYGEQQLRAQEMVKSQETTLFNAAYTGKGSLINEMA